MGMVAPEQRIASALRAHGLIAKIPHSNRYKVTDKGDALMWSAVFLRVDRFPKALNAVA